LRQEGEAKFDWDEANVAHIARHRVTRSEVEEALSSGPVDLDYDEIGGEPRWTSVGHTDEFRILLIVWTIRGDACRPITARLAPKGVRRDYLGFKGFSV